jgi:hypothetical protein
MIMLQRTALFTLGAMTISPAHALYDPKPIALLELVTGTWLGSLTYRDYQKPEKMVTLDTQMTVSLIAPDELSLYYVFDDGPRPSIHVKKSKTILAQTKDVKVLLRIEDKPIEPRNGSWPL